MPPKGFAKRKGKAGDAPTFFSSSPLSSAPPTPSITAADLDGPATFSNVALNPRQMGTANDVCCKLGITDGSDVNLINRICHQVAAGFSLCFIVPTSHQHPYSF